MASSTNKSSRGRGKKANSRTGKGTATRKIDQVQLEQDRELFREIGMIVFCGFMLFLLLCGLGIISGKLGTDIRGVMFGIFGFPAYVTPVLIFLAVAFWFANQGNPTALRKLLSGVALYLMLGVMCELIGGSVREMNTYSAKTIFDVCRDGRCGGGVLAGSLAYLLYHNLEMVGTVLIVLLCSVISLILLTERSFIDSMRDGRERLREFTAGDPERQLEDMEAREEARAEALRRREEAREEAARRREEAETRRREEAESRREAAENKREAARQRREEQERLRAEREEERRLKAEEKENDKILRMEKKVSGYFPERRSGNPQRRYA